MAKLIGLKEAEESKDFPILWMVIIEKAFPDIRKGMQIPGKIKNIKRFFTVVRKVFQDAVGNSVWIFLQ